MSITDELREWAKGDVWSHSFDEFDTIVSRIDAEYQKAIRELNSLADASVLLPVDADGVPICIGDVIAYKDNTKPKEVVALVPPSVVMVDDGPRYADMCRHYHEPTVKDVLFEFVDRWNDTHHEDIPALFDEFAAKLRLASDGEER